MEEFTRAVSRLLSSTNPAEVSVGLEKVRARMPRALATKRSAGTSR